MPYLSAFAVMIHYEEALYQVYAPTYVTRELNYKPPNINIVGVMCDCIYSVKFMA